MDSFTTLNKQTRIPQKFKKLIRKAQKTTIIYPNNESYRVISPNSEHYNFISKFHKLYSTSANKTNEKFDFDYAYDKADIIVFTKENFCEKNSSKIFKIKKNKIKKIR